ncbi:MAG: hypothetical protein ACK41C_02590 [Phenylobacterium sp.]|uniref:hypothetical protein n=1 Tax=Phenylobacterium sp. TaxID=1871053 RepID=UPI00391CABF1
MDLTEEVERLVSDYPRTGPPIVAEVLAVLLKAREHFCDLEDWTVFLAVLTRAQSAGAFGAVSRGDLLAGKIAELPGGGTNVRSISESCRIPRETVRRKVAAMVARGFLERRGGRLYPTVGAMQALDPLRMQIYASAARVWQVVDRTRRQS